MPSLHKVLRRKLFPGGRESMICVYVIGDPLPPLVEAKVHIIHSSNTARSVRPTNGTARRLSLKKIYKVYGAQGVVCRIVENNKNK